MLSTFGVVQCLLGCGSDCYQNFNFYKKMSRTTTRVITRYFGHLLQTQNPENTIGGSITVRLVSSLTSLDSTDSLLTNNSIFYLLVKFSLDEHETSRIMCFLCKVYWWLAANSSVTRLGDLLDFGPILKPLATINLPKSPTFVGNCCKGVKIFDFSIEIIFGRLL